MNSRTSIEFRHHGDIWSVISPWAVQNGFRPRKSPDDDRLFQKGIGFLVAPMMFRVIQNGDLFTLESWVRVNPFARACTLFILPAELSIESGGLQAMAPRKIARTAVNKLLTQLQLPLIP